MEENTHLWVQGVSPPFPSEEASSAEQEEFLRRCSPAQHILQALPKRDWEVAEFPALDLHVIKIPYMGHTWARPYMQRNVRSDKQRLIIAFRDYQNDHLRMVFDAVMKRDGGRLYKQATAVAKNSSVVLELQHKVEQATRALAGYLKKLDTQSSEPEQQK